MCDMTRVEATRIVSLRSTSEISVSQLVDFQRLFEVFRKVKCLFLYFLSNLQSFELYTFLNF